MFLRSLDECRLVIGKFPPFQYDARGGGGKTRTCQNTNINVQKISFDKNTFKIPPLSWRTAKFMGIPLLPGLLISMSMNKLEGKIDTKNGDIALDFDANFIFKVWPNYSFPDLKVSTTLVTGRVNSLLHNVEGQALDIYGCATLVGVAIIEPTQNILLNWFLGLPNEALAVLQCQINFDD